MPTSAGPNTVGESNIVFSYDIGDIKNSYRGEPTTNLLAAVGSDAAIERSGTGYPYYWVNIDSAVQPNWSPSNNTLTLSFEGKRDYSVGGTGGGGDGYPVFYVYFTDWSWAAAYGIATYDWSYDEYTFTMPNPAGKTVAFSIYHMNAGNPGMSYSRNHQIEFKSHATQFVNGTRSATQGLLPLLGNASLDISTISFDSNAQMTFDGTDDFINLATNLQSGFTQATYEFICKPTSLPGAWNYFQLYIQENSTWIALYNVGGTIFFGIDLGNGSGWFDNNGGWTTGARTTATLSANKYYHIVYSWNGSSVSIYLNGILQNTASTLQAANGRQNVTTLGSGNTPRNIGARGGANYWPGNIDIIKFYNTALSANQIKQNYQQYKTRFNLS